MCLNEPSKGTYPDSFIADAESNQIGLVEFQLRYVRKALKVLDYVVILDFIYTEMKFQLAVLIGVIGAGVTATAAGVDVVACSGSLYTRAKRKPPILWNTPL